jgi:Raf kinase inhibitor-like YbhB/YbcL family protein
MRRLETFVAFAALLACASAGVAQEEFKLAVAIGGGQQGLFPPKSVLCALDQGGRMAPGPNRSPELSWSPGPPETRSYALTMTDEDVPADLSNINRDGVTIPEGAPRMEFAHWVLADIPVEVRALAEGEEGASGKGGEALVLTDHGRRGENGFAAFLKDGPYGGYMGPCPPMNDQKAHRYRITVYALDVPSLGLTGAFTGADLLAAIKGHVLASGSKEALYGLSKEARQ